MIRALSMFGICLVLCGCQDSSEPIENTSSPTVAAETPDPQSKKQTSSEPSKSESSKPGTDPEPNSDAREKVESSQSDGQLGGRPFEVNSVELNEGILDIRQGEDTFSENKLTLFLFLDESGVVPEGQSFVVEKDAEGFGHPHIHVRMKGPDDKFSQSEVYVKDYELNLTFGKEAEKGSLPFTIDLKLPDEQESYLKGKFVAEVTGFRLIDGKVDLTSDSFRTLEHVAQHYLGEQHDGGKVDVTETRNGMYTHHDPENTDQRQVGRNIYQYRIGDEDPQWTKLIFVKEESGWKVEDQIELHQLFLAHPIFAPDESARRGDYSQQLVAQHLEQEFAEMEEPPFVHDVNLIVSYVPSSEFNKVRARYRIGENEEETKRGFVTQGTDENCRLIREIDDEAEIDPQTGKVKSE